MPALDRRLAGVLLHPTSLPGPHGSGDFGPAAWHFVEWLASAAQNVWQVLPLTPVGPGNSPYASVSAFAGSPALVALEPLVERGWLAVLGLGRAGRMNEPGRQGAWGWRFDWSQVGPEPARRLAELSAACGRAPIERLGLPDYPADRVQP